MTTTAFRRFAFGAVPAVVLVGALAGCNDSAPTVEAPSSTANSAAATDTGVPTEPPSTDAGTDQSTESGTDDSVPTVSEQPSSPSASGDPTKVCTTDTDSFVTPGVVGPDTEKAGWGKPLDLKQKYSGTVTMTAAKPTSKKPTKDDIFAPDNGQTYLLVKVSVKYKSGERSLVGDSYFTLRDGKKNLCQRESSLSEAVPDQDRFDLTSISKTSKTYTGTLVFAVPPGQDYSKYTLMYRVDDFDNKSADAAIAWTK